MKTPPTFTSKPHLPKKHSKYSSKHLYKINQRFLNVQPTIQNSLLEATPQLGVPENPLQQNNLSAIVRSDSPGLDRTYLRLAARWRVRSGTRLPPQVLLLCVSRALTHTSSRAIPLRAVASRTAVVYRQQCPCGSRSWCVPCVSLYRGPRERELGPAAFSLSSSAAVYGSIEQARSVPRPHGQHRVYFRPGIPR